EHLEKVVGKTGTVDISFNAIAVEVVQNLALIALQADAFMTPVTMMTRTRFLTAVAAAGVMMKQGSGLILSLTATPGGIGYPYTGGFAPACAAIESWSRNLAAEFGVHGVRSVNIRSSGS